MPSNEPSRSPTLSDRAFQLAYVCAFQLMRAYWTVRRPTTHGALVTLWNEGQVLLVRNSYVPYYSLPGGYIHAGEGGSQAAARELGEEVGLRTTPEQLTLVHEETHPWQGKQDHVQIFSLDLPKRPEIKIDHREVIEAAWWSPERALTLNLFPPLRTVLEQRARNTQTAAR